MSTDGTGWLGGGGMEVDLGSGFSARGEYRYTRLELDAFPGAHDNIQEGLFSLVYKFGGNVLNVPAFESAKPLK
jgi:opacity protein-like surface antigen